METKRRNTKQREIVLDAVKERKDHPTADEIYLDIIKEYPKVSRGTVYRNLNILSQEGEIRHVKVPQGADRFDWRLDRHYHVLCINCLGVMDIEIPYDVKLDLEAARQCGFDVFVHRTVFEGLCPECQKKSESI